MCKPFRIFHYLKKFDKFEVPISFRHKKEDTYTTWIGGVITLALVLSAIAFGIVYFIPFVKKENYSLYYYTINLQKTEEINFKKSRATLAYRFDCPEDEDHPELSNYNIEDFIETAFKYNYYEGGKQNQTTFIHNCTDSDFYNDKSLLDSIDNETFNEMKCFDDLDKVVKNRFQDRHDNFTYFQLDINLKRNIDPVLANNFLIYRDCKIELYYRDTNNDPEDFDEPIKPFIFENFLQLNPDFESRMNVYFMNSYFENNNDLLFETKGSEKQNTTFSRTEQYYLHKTGNTIGKIYIRADTRKMIIKRTYQTLTEFFAVTFSFWEDLFIICNFILNTYDKFCLNLSIGKKLFFFEGKDHTHFSFQKNSEKIKELINKTNSISEQLIPYTFIRKKTPKIMSKKQEEGLETNTIKDLTQNNIPIKNSFDSLRELGKNKENNKEIKSKQTLNRLVLIPLKFWDFLNVFEFNCCKCTKLEQRTTLFSNAEDIINSKLDIVNYLKSILLLDIIKKIAMDGKQEMLNFLCMPLVSPDKEEDMSYYHYHKIFDDEDFLRFSHEINLFMEKNPLTLKEEEKKLISLVNHRLRRYIN